MRARTRPLVATTALSLDHVVLTRRGVAVLAGIELTLDPGRTTAVMGRSGVGKTTLLEVACGLVRPDAGTVVVDGVRLDDARDAVRSRTRLRDVGLVFQRDELLPELTIGENVSLPLRLAGATTTEASARVAEVLGLLDIGDLAGRGTDQVSGGQLQRAAIARALVHRPALVLADEPTAALDEATAREAMALLLTTAAAEGAAVLVVTHDASVADMADTTYSLSDGRLTSRAR